MAEPSMPVSVDPVVADSNHRLRQALANGERPNLSNFLPHDAALRTTALVELVKTSIDWMRRHGEEPPIQSWLKEFPELRADPTMLALLHTPPANSGEKMQLSVTGSFHPGADSETSPLEALASTLPFSEHPGTPSAAGSNPVRYRTLRPHAKGGLGEVFVAEDLELHREVALKEIQRQRADDLASRHRFVQEAEITGGLEHPGIVPVYGLGTYADGRPFYAMRFIRGKSLKDAIGEFHQSAGATSGRANSDGSRQFAFRNLLGRFVAVCNAVGYAHSRGVVHRDLKPANIMLGEFGETLVVDWGLAKAANRAESRTAATGESLHPAGSGSVEATMPGVPLGTPAFMSPEQAAGRIGEIGPASDIYSLGATLFYLLTDQPPVGGGAKNGPPADRPQLDEVLDRVRRGAIQRPSEIRPDAPRPLAAICQKALALAPQDRYVSAKALGEDVERWLADEPVSAWQEPVLIRVRRWLRRHQTFVSVSAATILVALASLSVIVGVIGHKNNQLDVANWQLDDKNRQLAVTNDELEASNLRERRAAHFARLQQTEAEQAARFAREQSQFALTTLSSVIFEIQGSLRHVAGAGEVRRNLLNTAVARLKQLSDNYLSRDDIDRNTLVAISEMGDVILRIGAGMEPVPPATAEGGEKPQDSPIQLAFGLYSRAFEIASTLVEAAPKNPAALRDLSITCNRLGDINLRMGNVSEATRFYEQGRNASQQLVELVPEDLLAQRGLSASFEKLADASVTSGEYDEALRFLDQGLAIDEQQAAAHPDATQTQLGLWIKCHKLGDLAMQMSRVADATRYFERGLQISQGLAAKHPQDAVLSRNLAVAHFNLGDVSLRTEKYAEAARYFEAGLQVIQRLAKADPRDQLTQRDVMISHLRLGDLYSRTGDLEDAVKHFELALTACQQRVDADPRNMQAQRDLSFACENVADGRLKTGASPEAIKFYQRSTEIRERLAQADPNNAEAQYDLAFGRHHLGDCYYQQFAYEAALDQFQQCLATLDALSAAGRVTPQGKLDQGTVGDKAAKVRAALRATLPLDKVLMEPNDEVPGLLDRRVSEFSRKGDLNEATATAAALLAWDPPTAHSLFSAARSYCACVWMIDAPPVDGILKTSPAQPRELSAAETEARQRYLELAMSALERAVAAGWNDLNRLRGDNDLAPLRDLPAFQKLVEQLSASSGRKN